MAYKLLGIFKTLLRARITVIQVICIHLKFTPFKFQWIATTQNNIALDLKEEEFPCETRDPATPSDPAPVPRSEAAAAIEGKAYRDRLFLRF